MSLSQFPNENDQSDTEIVTLIDEDERSLDCYVERSFEIEGSTYLMLMPIAAAVTIIAWDNDHEDSGAVWLEDEAEIKEIFGDAKAVLAEHNLTLQHSAFTLTATGELPSTSEDDILILEIEEEEGDSEAEEYQFLATFYHHGKEYEIYTPLAPLLFFAKTTYGNQLELTSPEEFKLLQPFLEELLFEGMD
ncbi:MAG: DUF3727 domain-containing protein [Spirulinaceae cyanobacterium]